MGVHMLKREGTIFQTREEAEEADHARWGSVLPTSSNLSCTELNSLICVWRYNEKQARIAERRRLNFEKKLAVRGNNLYGPSSMSFTAFAWSSVSSCRRDTNATSRRTALRLFLPKQSWSNTSRLTRRSWRSAWYAPTTHPGWASILSLPFDLIFDSIKENDMWQEVP